jgi:hypothetical protein
MLKVATEIAIPNLENIKRLEADFPRLYEAVEYLKVTKIDDPHWSWAVLFFFLEYGRNFKKLAPIASKAHILLGPLVWVAGASIGVVAKELYIKEKEINIPFVDKILKGI